jgi:predicted transcriptional regulator
MRGILNLWAKGAPLATRWLHRVTPLRIYSYHSLLRETKATMNRGKYAILADILSQSLYGAKKTHILFKCNLSHRQLTKYLNDLLAKQMIEQEAVFWRTTDKGLDFLHHCQKAITMYERADS